MTKIGNIQRASLPRWFADKEYENNKKIIHDFVDYYVERALESRKTHASGTMGDQRYIFLHALAESTTDPVRLRSEALNILLAGRDTTAGLLGILWHVLSKHPEVWKKLHAEVDMLEGERPTFEQIKGHEVPAIRLERK